MPPSKSTLTAVAAPSSSSCSCRPPPSPSAQGGTASSQGSSERPIGLPNADEASSSASATRESVGRPAGSKQGWPARSRRAGFVRLGAPRSVANGSGPRETFAACFGRGAVAPSTMLTLCPARRRFARTRPRPSAARVPLCRRGRAGARRRPCRAWVRRGARPARVGVQLPETPYHGHPGYPPRSATQAGTDGDVGKASEGRASSDVSAREAFRTPSRGQS